MKALSHVLLLLATLLARLVGSAQIVNVHSAYNVASYGAKGNGIADDSGAINAAITAASSAGGGQVYLPAGIYDVASSLNVPSFVNVVGAGSGSTIIRADGVLSPNLNVVQAGYNSGTCVQAFGAVTVTGTLPGVLTLPMQTSVGGGGAITATSAVSSGNIIATFTGTFGGSNGMLPLAQQVLVGTGFTGATGYNSAWTVISSNATAIVAYQAGSSSFDLGSMGTLSLSFTFPAAGTWNNQYVFIAGTQYQVTSSTGSSLTLANYNGPPGSQTFQGVYSGCPVGFSVENLTIDANCGSSNASGIPCQSGGRGPGAGNAVACRGCYRSTFRDPLILHSPNDALYTEGGLFVSNVIPPYSGGAIGTFGLANTVHADNVRIAEANNVGVEHLGPSDGIFINTVVSFTGGVGVRVACIPGGYGVCGTDTFWFGPHVYKSGSWDYQILAEQYLNSAEAESSAANGAFSCDFLQDITNTSYCVLKANMLVADNITGDCLYLNSPSTSFSSTFAIVNGITNLDCSAVTGYGIHATTATGRTSITLANISGPTSGSWSGCVYWPANSASLNDIRCVNPNGIQSPYGFDFSGATPSLNRFTGNNLNAVNFVTAQIRWPSAASFSRIGAYVAANGGESLYTNSPPTGIDYDVQVVCNLCADMADGSLMTRAGGQRAERPSVRCTAKEARRLGLRRG